MKSLTAFFILALCTHSFAGDPPITVEPSGDPQVDELVSHLVSTKPAPYPTGCYSGMTLDSYETPEVAEAMDSLIKLGPKAFPALVKDLTYIILMRLFISEPIEGWASIMVAILVLGGMQMTMLGVLGEYIWRTLEEARKRPLYFVEDAAGFHEDGPG